ncbi:1-phosphofructokinase [Alteribacter lacisalsi]|uniref:Tagatose-6-phosphate kinase n=1 Tax=Alteribacter lacisalsi TaxID=2045244 RepID=A0A2W0H7J9_9BACI|nr:1-phosphofructokinase [Alteribacter lacisalsi]PYZ97097.1 1-phosphofructokinase [Alteribacter lacisalsi]
MIYTVTLNPSADYFMDVPDFETGRTNRAAETQVVPGGKGINVSRVLTRLEVKTKAIGFLAGFTGTFIENTLKEENLDTSFVYTEGMTRINVKLKAGSETEINGTGCRITDRDQEELFGKLGELNGNDYLVLAGSLPDGADKGIYRKAVELANRSKTKAIVDTVGLPLTEALKAGPYLIKPNEAELSDFAGRELSGLDDVRKAAESAVQAGAENVLVSLGSRGALLVNRNHVLSARPPEGTLVNSVGAGDSMVAGFLYGETLGLPLKDCFAYSVASGSATAFSQGFCHKEQVETLVKRVIVKHESGEEE